MRKRILLFAFVLFVPAVSYSTIRPVITLSGGFARANVYSSTVIAFSPFQNSYIASKHDDTETDTGLLIGGETPFLQHWAWQLGISYFVNDSFTATGNVYQFSDPNFNNLSYQYQIKSRRLTIDTKLSRVFREIWHPYVSAGIGEAFNKAYDYTEYPVSSADVPMAQPFANHTTNTFTYSVGFGVDVTIAKNWRLGGGYRFIDLGSVNLGTTPLQSGTATIGKNHVYANEILAQISYVG